MPPYILTVRFPLAFLGDGRPERFQDATPAHEKQGHAFYETDLQVLADELLELFRHGDPDPAVWSPSAAACELAERAGRGELVDWPAPIFGVVDGADLGLAQSVRYQGEVRRLRDITDTGLPDPAYWETLLGLPHDPGTALRVRLYEQAGQWEPLVFARLREGNPRDWGEDPGLVARRGKAFGSSPGGRGRAGQRKARPPRKSAPGKTRCAGTQSAISPNENEAETSAGRSKVFISYSHKDRKWLERLHVHLKGAVREGEICLWDDTMIRTGSKWRMEIKKALAAAKVGVLLVSADFLASDFIAENELLPLLEAEDKGGLRIVWILLSDCPYKRTPISDYHAAHDIEKPLASLRGKAAKERALTEICEKIIAEAHSP